MQLRISEKRCAAYRPHRQSGQQPTCKSPTILKAKPLSGRYCSGRSCMAYMVAQRQGNSTVERAELHWRVLRTCFRRSTSWANSALHWSFARYSCGSGKHFKNCHGKYRILVRSCSHDGKHYLPRLSDTFCSCQELANIHFKRTKHPLFCAFEG